MSVRRVLALAVAAALGAGGLAAFPTQAADDPRTQGCIQSVSEPGSEAPTPICFTIYRPAIADGKRKVPMVMHSHGWGGSRTNAADAFADWLKDGFGIISFDQRGFGESGGKAHIENPDFEGEDVRKLVDHVAALDWVLLDKPGDPRIGAIGGSYGGGYQFAGAFADLWKRGVAGTRFDALIPEITWWDLRESLAPQGVPRTAWTTALYAAGARSVPNEVHTGFAYGAATGDWPVGQHGVPVNLDTFFERNGPSWHVAQGRKLDIPVLFGQGITDNLFNLNQGLKNFDRALTDRARAKSIFVGYNGGHALPSVLPMGTSASAQAGTVGGDPCSKKLNGGNFAALSRRFMSEHLLKIRQFLPGQGQVHLANEDGTVCITSPSRAENRTITIDQAVTTVGAGAPIATELAAGPLTVTGTPFVDADVTTLSAEGRAFMALAVGTNVADAKIIGNNMLPIRESLSPTPVHRTIELPAMAVDVAEGQKLFLIISPVSDMSFGHGSRTPGAMVLENVVVRLHVQ